MIPSSCSLDRVAFHCEQVDEKSVSSLSPIVVIGCKSLLFMRFSFVLIVDRFKTGLDSLASITSQGRSAVDAWSSSSLKLLSPLRAHREKGARLNLFCKLHLQLGGIKAITHEQEVKAKKKELCT